MQRKHERSQRERRNSVLHPFRVVSARRTSPSILKEISSEYALEGLMLKLKLQYFGTPDARIPPIRKDSDAGED